MLALLLGLTMLVSVGLPAVGTPQIKYEEEVQSTAVAVAEDTARITFCVHTFTSPQSEKKRANLSAFSSSTYKVFTFTSAGRSARVRSPSTTISPLSFLKELSDMSRFINFTPAPAVDVIYCRIIKSGG